MEFTGERFESGLGGPIEYEHLHRFAVCRELTRGKVVLDIASGAGIGSAIFAQTAERVVGIDIDRASIEAARARFAAISNLTFTVGSCSAIPARDASFDVVISLETIEHIGEQEQFLSEVRRVLKPDGVFVVSTPDRRVYSVLPNFKNPFHVKELEPDEFRALLAAFFPAVEIYGQRLGTASFLTGHHADAPAYASFRRHERTFVQVGTSSLPDPVYLLAVCAASGSPPRLLPSLYLDREDDLFARTDAYYRGELQKAHAEIAALKRSDLLGAHWRFVNECRAERSRQAAARIVFDRARARAKANSNHELMKSHFMGAVRDRKLRPGSAEKSWTVSNIGPLFDARWYLENNPDLADIKLDPLTHFIRHGGKEGRNPHLLFASHWYLQKNPEVAAAGINPLLHYLQIGWRSGKNPHPLFDVDWYQYAYPDSAGVEPLGHYLTQGWLERRDPNPLFSTWWYLETHVDIPPNVSPLVHYVLEGFQQGRRTHPLFDPAWYMSRNRDVRESGLDPLVHFLEVGAAECRDPHPLFASSWCLARDSESQQTGQHPIRAYVARGFRAGQDPHPFFSTSFYARTNSDVIAKQWNPVEHYIWSGSREGRNPHPLFRTMWYQENSQTPSGEGWDPFVWFLERGIAEGRRPHPEFEPAWVYRPPATLVPAEENPFVGLAAIAVADAADGGLGMLAKAPDDHEERADYVNLLSSEFEQKLLSRFEPDIVVELKAALLTIMMYAGAEVLKLTYAPLLQDLVDRIRERASAHSLYRTIDVSVILSAEDAVSVLACIASILAWPCAFAFELIIEDGDLPEATAHLLSELPFPVRSLCRERRAAGMENLNAVEAAKGKYLFVPNNACFVFPDALNAMARALEGQEDVGAVTATLLRNGQAPECQASRAAVPAVMVEARLWRKLGGLDPAIPPDRVLSDFYARAQHEGHRVVAEPSAMTMGLAHIAEARKTGAT